MSQVKRYSYELGSKYTYPGIQSEGSRFVLEIEQMQKSGFPIDRFLSQITEELNRLDRELSEKAEDQDSDGEEIRRLSQQVDELESDMKCRDQEIEDKSEEIENLKREIASLESRVRELEQALES